MTKIVAIVNQQGGIVKITTTVNLSTALSVTDKQILVIDLDLQGNSNTSFGINQQGRKVTIYTVLTGSKLTKEAIIETNILHLQLITANTNFSGAESDLLSIKKLEYLLSDLLNHLVDDYDYVMIDCLPSLNMLTANALVACDNVLIPVQCDFYSLEGLSHLLKTIEIIEKNLNPKIKIAGILFTMYDKRNLLTEKLEEDVRKYLGRLVFKTVIPRKIKLSEVPSYGQPAIIYDHKCAGSVAYMELSKEILGRNIWKTKV